MKATLILAAIVAGSFVSAQSPSPITVPVQPQGHRRVSGGAIAGIVLGCLAALAIACLLAWCWRKKRHQHTAAHNTPSNNESQNHNPSRTVVTEKIEPVVVKSGTHQTHNINTPASTVVTEKIEPVVVKSGTHQTYNNNAPANTSSTNYNTTNQSAPTNQGYNAGLNTVHPSTSYNTTTTAGYNTANSGYNSASNNYNTGYNTANDARNDARGAH
ncbi:hypothetical protein BGZ47_010531 [Haplosporangium gracile]|nr:hypothetical protein BGZ47_010531 [Haplosporangium gracile]